MENPAVLIDNYASERALRTVALRRKNFPFVGNDIAGAKLDGAAHLGAVVRGGGRQSVDVFGGYANAGAGLAGGPGRGAAAGKLGGRGLGREVTAQPKQRLAADLSSGEGGGSYIRR